MNSSFEPWVYVVASQQEAAPSQSTEPEPERWVVLNNELVPKSYLQKNTIPTSLFIDHQSGQEIQDKPTRWCFVNGTVAAYTPEETVQVKREFEVKDEPKEIEEDTFQPIIGAVVGSVAPIFEDNSSNKRLSRKRKRPSWLDTYTTDIKPLRKGKKKSGEDLPDEEAAKQAKIDSADKSAPDSAEKTDGTPMPDNDAKDSDTESCSGFVEYEMTPRVYQPGNPRKTPQKGKKKAKHKTVVKKKGIVLKKKRTVIEPKVLRKKLQTPQWLDTYNTDIKPLRKEDEIESRDQKSDQKSLLPKPNGSKPSMTKIKANKALKKAKMNSSEQMVVDKVDVRSVKRKVQKPQWLETYSSDLQPLRKLETDNTPTMPVNAKAKTKQNKSKKPKLGTSAVKKPKENVKDEEIVNVVKVQETENKEDSGSKTYKCETCKTETNSKVSFDKHVKSCSGKLNSQCEHCDRKFKWGSDLVRHQRAVHNKERPYVCPVCGNTFTQKQDVFRHLRSHVDMKPHDCNMCEKSFSRRDTLLRHKREAHLAVKRKKGPEQE